MWSGVGVRVAASPWSVGLSAEVHQRMVRQTQRATTAQVSRVGCCSFFCLVSVKSQESGIELISHQSRNHSITHGRVPPMCQEPAGLPQNENAPGINTSERGHIISSMEADSWRRN